MKLRDYQDELVVKARKSLIDGFIRPIVVAPTGSGKTVMFSYIADQAVKRGKRVLIIVHRAEILEQTLKKLYDFGLVAGQITGTRRMTTDYIQVAMVGTLVNRLGKIFKPDIILSDEHHHAVSRMWSKILSYFYDVPCIGWTATPERLDGVGLGDVGDTLIEGPTTNTLVKRGFLANPRIFSSKTVIEKEFKTKMGDYDKNEQTDFMTKRIIIGDVIDHYRKFLEYKPTITFCCSIRHAQEMQAAYSDVGYNPVIIHGKMNKTERQDAVKGLSDGTYHQMISCEVVSEGFDVPVVAGVQMLRRTQSLGLYLQQGGRALRLFEGKTDAVILDHVNNYKIHGHLLADRKWDLHRGKRNVKKEEAPEITRCPQCFEILPGKPRKCAPCGYDFELAKKKVTDKRFKVISEELQEMMPEGSEGQEIDKMAKFIDRINNNPNMNKTKALWSMAYQLDSKEKIDALRKQMKFKPGWTRIVWEKVKKNKHNT